MQMLRFDYRTLHAAFFRCIPSLTQVAQGDVAILWVKAVLCLIFLLFVFGLFFFSFPGKYRIVCVTPLHSRYLLWMWWFGDTPRAHQRPLLAWRYSGRRSWLFGMFPHFSAWKTEVLSV
ncbi:uncharacterized protein WM294_012559 isoform 1-T1 [Sarcoramphus papa]